MKEESCEVMVRMFSNAASKTDRIGFLGQKSGGNQF